jgi:glutamate synthase (NADPH/NADH) large chain
MTKYDANWVAAEQKKRAWVAKNGLYSEAEEHAS